RSAPWLGAFFFTKRAGLRLFADRQREYMVESGRRSGKNERGPQPNPPCAIGRTGHLCAAATNEPRPCGPGFSWPGIGSTRRLGLSGGSRRFALARPIEYALQRPHGNA